MIFLSFHGDVKDSYKTTCTYFGMGRMAQEYRYLFERQTVFRPEGGGWRYSRNWAEKRSRDGRTAAADER